MLSGDDTPSQGSFYLGDCAGWQSALGACFCNIFFLCGVVVAHKQCIWRLYRCYSSWNLGERDSYGKYLRRSSDREERLPSTVES